MATQADLESAIADLKTSFNADLQRFEDAIAALVAKGQPDLQPQIDELKAIKDAFDQAAGALPSP